MGQGAGVMIDSDYKGQGQVTWGEVITLMDDVKG